MVYILDTLASLDPIGAVSGTRRASEIGTGSHPGPEASGGRREADHGRPGGYGPCNGGPGQWLPPV